MIFGLQHSKIIYNGDTIDLPYSDLDPKFCIPNEIEQVSITGKKYYVNSMDYDSFTIIYFLFKHGINSALKYQELESIKKQLVNFYPHIDGSPVQDTQGTDVLFYVKNITPYYLQNLNKYDMLEIILEPTIPIFRSRNHGYGMDWGYWS